MAFAVQVVNLKKNEGAYRSGAHTGVLAGVAAGSASAGHIWCARNPAQSTSAPNTPRQKVVVVTLFRAQWVTTTGPTAAQQVGLELFKVTGYTALHTGGTGAAALTPSKRNTSHPSPLLTGRIAGTDALTNGTEVFDTDPYAAGAAWDLAAAATVPTARFDCGITTDSLALYPLILQSNEGLVLRNKVAMAGGGGAVVNIDFEWLEVERF